jgi:hypothetical protein
MGVLKHYGKIEYVDKESVHRMSEGEVKAYIKDKERERERHRKAMNEIDEFIATVKREHHRGEPEHYIILS